MRRDEAQTCRLQSFVDPHHGGPAGQLVGVPLAPTAAASPTSRSGGALGAGESKASELRGESMQDVIFNGSSNRKPVSRASVELIFEQFPGPGHGPERQPVRRVVGEAVLTVPASSINPTTTSGPPQGHHRPVPGHRPGPRAYAIIGQGHHLPHHRGEARRAAGVPGRGSRRHPLQGTAEERRCCPADTRENRPAGGGHPSQLAGQMERLEAQAAVARQYHQLNDELTLK